MHLGSLESTQEAFTLFSCSPNFPRASITRLIIKITISSLAIGLKNVLSSTNSPAKLLSDSLLLDSLLLDILLSDSSISQSHSKVYFKSTNHIQSCNSVCVRARLLLCFCQ